MKGKKLKPDAMKQGELAGGFKERGDVIRQMYKEDLRSTILYGPNGHEIGIREAERKKLE